MRCTQLRTTLSFRYGLDDETVRAIVDRVPQRCERVVGTTLNANVVTFGVSAHAIALLSGVHGQIVKSGKTVRTTRPRIEVIAESSVNRFATVSASACSCGWSTVPTT